MDDGLSKKLGLVFIGVCLVVALVFSVFEKDIFPGYKNEEATNAIWLKDGTEVKWVYYQIVQEDGKSVIKIESLKNTPLYTSHPEGKTDVRGSPKEQIWLCDTWLTSPRSSYWYWSSLTPIKTLCLEEHSGSKIFARLDEKKWLYFVLPNSIISQSGFLRTEIKEGENYSHQA